MTMPAPAPDHSTQATGSAKGGLDEEINLVRVLRSVLRYKIMVISIVIATTALALVAALVMRPVYRSEVLLAPAKADESQSNLSSITNQFGGLASLAGINVRSGGGEANEAIAILRSRSFTQAFITQQELMPVLFSERWDPEKHDWLQDGKKPPTIADAYQLFATRIRTLEVDNRTGLVTLGIEWTDPMLAADWANALVARLNQYIRERDVAEARRSLQFLGDELEKSSTIDLRQGIYRLIEHQIERVMLANVRPEYAFRILDPGLASDPDKRVRPNRRLMAVAGLAIGMVIAILAVFFRVALDKDRRS